MCVSMCHDMSVEVRTQLVKICSLHSVGSERQVTRPHTRHLFRLSHITVLLQLLLNGAPVRKGRSALSC